MFFIISVNQGKKNIGHQQLVICDKCGQYGRYEILMTYNFIRLFFIPLFRWKRRYYVKTSCCYTLYQLNTKIGNRIRRGKEVEITTKDLTLLQRGNNIKQAQVQGKFCIHCSFTTTEPDFAYCPRCGKLLEENKQTNEKMG